MMQAASLVLLGSIANAGGGGGGGPTFPAGATHYWALEEAAGNNRVDSVGGLSMVEQGGTSPNAVGKHGNCLDLRGAATKFLQSASFSLLEGFSLVLWANVTSLTASVFLDKSVSAGFTIQLSGGNVTFRSSDDGDSASVALGTLGVWHLIVATSVGGTDSLSIDGGAFVTATYFGGFDDTSIATIGFSGASPDALIDEVAIFQRALTQQEVTDIWNGGVGRFGP